MDGYGVRLFSHGFQFYPDGRVRRTGKLFGTYLLPRILRGTKRGEAVSRRLVRPRIADLRLTPRHVSGGIRRIRSFSWPSLRRLEFTAANAEVCFRSHVTLTYRAPEEEGEASADRNRRIVLRSKADLGRFLTCLRGELGAYLWVQEFQQRGVVHYHLLCEAEVSADRIRTVWLRSIGALDDPAALKHGVRVDMVGEQLKARRYLGTYLGKARQKALPVGVRGAGRWWGCSRQLRSEPERETICGWKDEMCSRQPEITIVRVLRRFAARCTGRKIRSGPYTDWSGELSGRLLRVLDALQAFYGATLALPASLEDFDREVA